MPVGRSDGEVLRYSIAGTGEFQGAGSKLLTEASALPIASVAPVALSLAGQTYLYGAASDGVSIQAYRLSGGAGTLSGTKPADPLQDAQITALGNSEADGKAFLLAGVSGAEAVVSYAIASNGSLREADRLSATEGLPIATPTAIVTMSDGQQNFAVLGAAGTSSLSVISLDPTGAMTVLDQVVDERGTRFDHLSGLATASFAEQDFLVATGADDGLSLFTLLPGGRLFYLASVADTNDTHLQNVSALTMTESDGGLTVIAASQSDPGLSSFHIDLSRLGQIYEADQGAARQMGGGRDDILIARTGDAVLTGGTGDDCFIFAPSAARTDGKLGQITDFDIAHDRLDLSAFPLLHSVEQLEISGTSDGAIVRFGEYWIEVDAANKTTIAPKSFTTEGVLNACHLQVGETVFAYEQNLQPSTDTGLTLAGRSGTTC
ncbi:hypothetical protein FGG78_20190 [Thioclava sp. BHET1]|nr:hypothetical protein FGG78_20190 [Thioclava sp. BHET1]